MRAKMQLSGSTRLWLSASDTYEWATRPRASWPGSQLSGSRLYCEFASNGDLVDVLIDGQGGVEIDANEFNAITSDYLRERFGDSHPAIRD